MLKITPKNNLLEFKLQVSNASMNKTKARLVVEVQDMASTMIDLDIDQDGKCVCEIPLQENWNRKPGKVKLEVIAENTYFTPYEKEVFFLNENIKPKVTITESKNIQKPVIKEEVSIPKIKQSKEDLELMTEIQKFFGKK